MLHNYEDKWVNQLWIMSRIKWNIWLYLRLFFPLWSGNSHIPGNLSNYGMDVHPRWPLDTWVLMHDKNTRTQGHFKVKCWLSHAEAFSDVSIQRNIVKVSWKHTLFFAITLGRLWRHFKWRSSVVIGRRRNSLKYFWTSHRRKNMTSLDSKRERLQWDDHNVRSQHYGAH